MTTEEIYNLLLSYKKGGTQQSCKKDLFLIFDNEYIRLVRIDSSNKSGGSSITQGKQWSFIVDVKKSFLELDSWRKLKSYMGVDLAVTPVTKGENAGKFGIRFYRMAKDPTKEIVETFFKYLFD